jgi:hypothetical protein
MSKRKAANDNQNLILHFFKKPSAVCETTEPSSEQPVNAIVVQTAASTSAAETFSPDSDTDKSFSATVRSESAVSSGEQQRIDGPTELDVVQTSCHITDVSRIPPYSCGGRKWFFNVQWYQTYPWLHWQDDKLLCHLCSTAIQTPGLVLSKRIEDAFSRTGASFIWKNAAKVFREHSTSQGHLEVSEKLAAIK